VLVRGQSRPYGLAVDANHVSWAAYREGAIKRIAR
jgi:hypothetical protein